MNDEVKICRGSWPMVFGLRHPATLAQTIAVLGAFGYDGIELGGAADHATLERYLDQASRRRLAEELDAAGMQAVTVVPGPNGDMGRPPWSTGGPDVLAEYDRWFGDFLQLAADVGARGIRVDPGVPGPLPYGTDHERVWDTVVRTFRRHAERGEEPGRALLWEAEPGQPFNKPSEVVRLVTEVGHANFQILTTRATSTRSPRAASTGARPLELLDGGQLELIEQLAGHIGHMHICDTDGRVMDNVRGTKLGSARGSSTSTSSCRPSRACTTVRGGRSTACR